MLIHGSLTLIRGIPGSGKSTLARKFIDEYKNRFQVNHYEADMFFMNGNEYNFDISKLGEAHAWCLEQTRRSLIDKKTTIVSNTFVQYFSMHPYMKLAQDFCIPLHIIVCSGGFQNIHDVPEHVLTKMKELWEP